MEAFRNLLRAHQLAAFFTLTLGLTWIAFVPWYWTNGDGIPFFTFGPMVAGFAVAGIAGGWPAIKVILGSMIRWRVSPIWYAVAIGLPFGIQLVSIALNPALGSASPLWEKIPPLMEILPIVAIYAVFSGPLGEEPGWRGFALPLLLKRHSAFVSSAVIGVIWTLWHLPLALVGDLSFYGSVTTLLAAFVFTWLYQNTGGSVLLAVLMHVAHQNSVRFLGKVFVDGDYLQQQWIGASLWTAVVVLILAVYGTESFASRRAFEPTRAAA